ncbi:MAG: undecaprenyldiphospho-muramoylpentapeptide beta-N-acetylglucosaminyltransferase [Candidatus Omnitrophota bacterium]|nr:undecaprenyldiphospho-muramoylpentapeptide beta-N-acetylglucosaminyltransferase [Candidatus Omnitrophota bacterium]
MTIRLRYRSGETSPRRNRRRVLIAAGGSGGHIFPAIALAKTLIMSLESIDIKFVGSDKDLDRRIFEKEGFKFSLLSVNKLPYGLSPRLPLFFVKLFTDLLKTIYIIAGYRPDIVVGFGGYCSFPVVLLSCLFGIPRIVHEQNMTPGRANKFLFRLADRIAVSFRDTINLLGTDGKKATFTGNPIRPEILASSGNPGSRENGIKKFGLDTDKFTVLVIGGSQGAHFLNETFIKAVSGLGPDVKRSIQIIHITGIKDYEWVMTAYGPLRDISHRAYSFIDRIEEAYSASDLIVTRSGASAIFEIALFGKPMILVPYPLAMSHQSENAKAFFKNGAAMKIEEDKLSAEMFKGAMLSLFNDRDRLKVMGEAAKKLSYAESSIKLARLVLGERADGALS